MQMCSAAHYTVGIKDSAESFLFEVRTFGSIFLTFFNNILNGDDWDKSKSINCYREPVAAVNRCGAFAVTSPMNS